MYDQSTYMSAYLEFGGQNLGTYRIKISSVEKTTIILRSNLGTKEIARVGVPI